MTDQLLSSTTVAELTANVPPWAAKFKLKPEPDGRLFLQGELDGAWVFVQPKAWSKMTVGVAARSPEAGAINYGIQLPQMQAHAGQLQTNDPTFGQQLLGATTEAECRPSVAPPNLATTPGLIPALIVGGGIVLAGLIVRLRRSPQ